MIKAAKKHRVAFAPINISPDLRKQLPTWQHLGIERQIPRNPRARCLAKNHESKRVKDMMKINDRLKGNYRGSVHTPVFSCHCDDCERDREEGCKNPQRCTLEAQRRLEKITPKLVKGFTPLCLT